MEDKNMDFSVSFIERNYTRKSDEPQILYWGPERITLLSICTRFYEKLYQVVCNSSHHVEIKTVNFIISKNNKKDTQYLLEINGCCIYAGFDESAFRNFIMDTTKMLYFIDYRESNVV